MNTKNILSILLLAACLMACKKDHTVNIAPEVTFRSPAEGMVLDEHDTVWVRLDITSQEDLHEYVIAVKNLSENKDAFEYNGHSDNRSVSANLYFIPNVGEDADMEMTVTTLDHNNNRSSKSMKFRIKNTVLEARPQITIVTPDQAYYNNHALLHIKGNVAHSLDLSSVHIMLTRNDSTVIDYTPVVTGTNYAFDTTYQLDVTGHSDFTLTVTAKDVNAQADTRTFSFFVHP